MITWVNSRYYHLWGLQIARFVLFLFQEFYDIILVRREGRIANWNTVGSVCSYEYNCIVLYLYVELSHALYRARLLLSRLLALGRLSMMLA